MTEDSMPAVRSWASRVEHALGIEGAELDLDAVLGIAGVAARSAVRPAAPVTTYLIGYATGLAVSRGVPSDEAFGDAIAAVRELAERSEFGGSGEAQRSSSDS